MKTIKYEGFWWLPSNLDKKLFGIIEFLDKSIIHFSVLGTFTQDRSLDNSDFYEIILGITKEGKDITLVKSSCIKTNIPSCQGIIHKEYRVTSVFLEIHYKTLKEMKFYKIVVEYDYLAHWVYYGIPNFIKEWYSQQPLENQNNPNLEAKTTKGKISIRVFANTFLDCLEFKQEKRSQIIIDLIEKELDINEWYLSYLYPLQNFLTLATNQKNLITSISVYSRHEPSLVHDIEIPVQLISGIISHDRLENKKSNEMLFTLECIESHFSLCIQKWLNINDEIKHICDIYFGIKYADFMYGELRFISIVQALESYHRIKIENDCNSLDKQQKQREHESKLKEIYNAVSENHIKWLKEKLAFSHEISFKNRIKDLSEKHKKTIDPLVKDRDKFSTKVGNTRNYYTHYDRSLTEKSAQENELFRLSQVLNFLLQSCILAELGFSSELRESLISKNGEYQYLIQELHRANFEW